MIKISTMKWAKSKLYIFAPSLKHPDEGHLRCALSI